MCVEFIVKYLLFFTNLVFWLGGIALIVIGSAVLTNVNAVLDLLPVDLSGIPIVTIVGGCIIFVIAFSGCYGAITESRCWLILFGVFMLILAAVSSYLAYVIFSNLSTLPERIQSWVNQAFTNHGTSGAFQIFETTFQCCGSTGAGAYTSLGLPIPHTCCPEPENNMCSANSSYEGCSARLGDYLDTYGEVVGIVVICVIVVQVLAMLAAFYLNSTITRKLQRGAMY